MAQQHLDHNSVVVVARQTVKLPEHDRIETSMFGGGAHFDKAVPFKAPARLGTILKDRDDYATALCDCVAAAGFLRLQTQLILHFG